MSYNMKICYLSKIYKLSIILINSVNKRVWNYNDRLVAIKRMNSKTLALTSPQKNLLLLLKLLNVLRNNTIVGGKFLFIDNNLYTSDLISRKISQSNHYFIGKPLNLSGNLTNFSHMRWYALKGGNDNFPYKKPNIVIILDSYSPYFPFIKEAAKLNIPVIGATNFSSIQTNKKILYTQLLSNFNHNNSKLFYFEVINYIINLSNSVVYLKRFSNNTRLKKITDNLKRYYIDIIYKRSIEETALSNIDYSISKFLLKKPITVSPKISNNIQTNFWSFTVFHRRVRPQKIQLYDFNKNKKWQWYRKKKFKYISLYTRNFISKGKFKAPFSKFKWRYNLLKKIFCNLFDLQYNFKTWWREVIKKGLYKRTKKFYKSFKSTEGLLLNFERCFVFLIKKYFDYSFKDLRFLIKERDFLINGKVKTNFRYIVKNDSIIQKKLYDTKIESSFDIFSYDKWGLFFLWRQYFFRRISFEDYKSRIAFAENGIPLIHPMIVDRLNYKNNLDPIFKRKVQLWVVGGMIPTLLKYDSNLIFNYSPSYKIKWLK